MKACMLAYTDYESDTRVQGYAQSLQRVGYEVDIVALGYRRERRGYLFDGVRAFHLHHRLRDEKSKTTHPPTPLLFFFRSMFLLTREHVRSRYDFIHLHSL